MNVSKLWTLQHVWNIISCIHVQCTCTCCMIYMYLKEPLLWNEEICTHILLKEKYIITWLHLCFNSGMDTTSQYTCTCITWMSAYILLLMCTAVHWWRLPETKIKTACKFSLFAWNGRKTNGHSGVSIKQGTLKIINTVKSTCTYNIVFTILKVKLKLWNNACFITQH